MSTPRNTPAFIATSLRRERTDGVPLASTLRTPFEHVPIPRSWSTRRARDNTPRIINRQRAKRHAERAGPWPSLPTQTTSKNVMGVTVFHLLRPALPGRSSSLWPDSCGCPPLACARRPALCRRELPRGPKPVPLPDGPGTDCRVPGERPERAQARRLGKALSRLAVAVSFTNSARDWFCSFVPGARFERALGLYVAPSWRFERQSSGSRPLILPLDELGKRLRAGEGSSIE